MLNHLIKNINHLKILYSNHEFVNISIKSRI